MVVTDDQVERGINLALERVNAPGVLIEGNSFLRFIDVDFAVLVAGGADIKIKSSARWAFQKASAVYLFDRTNQTSPSETVEFLIRKFGQLGLKRSLPAYGVSDFPKLVEHIKQIHSLRSDVFEAHPLAQMVLSRTVSPEDFKENHHER